MKIELENTYLDTDEISTISPISFYSIPMGIFISKIVYYFIITFKNGESLRVKSDSVPSKLFFSNCPKNKIDGDRVKNDLIKKRKDLVGYWKKD